MKKTAAHLALVLVPAMVLTACATDGAEGFGRPLPPLSQDSKRLPPYDPFGTGPADADEEADQPASASLGAPPPSPQPQQQAGSAGENTVTKSQQMAAVAPQSGEAASPQAPVDAGAAALSPFAGMTESELRAQWGAPSLVRAEAGASLWQYQGKGCVVLAYLYPSGGGGLETAYAEAHPGGANHSAVQNCLGKAVRGRDVSAAVKPRKPSLVVKPD